MAHHSSAVAGGNFGLKLALRVIHKQEKINPPSFPIMLQEARFFHRGRVLFFPKPKENESDGLTTRSPVIGRFASYLGAPAFFYDAEVQSRTKRRKQITRWKINIAYRPNVPTFSYQVFKTLFVSP